MSSASPSEPSKRRLLVLPTRFAAAPLIFVFGNCASTSRSKRSRRAVIRVVSASLCDRVESPHGVERRAGHEFVLKNGGSSVVARFWLTVGPQRALSLVVRSFVAVLVLAVLGDHPSVRSEAAMPCRYGVALRSKAE